MELPDKLGPGRSASWDLLGFYGVQPQISADASSTMIMLSRPGDGSPGRPRTGPSIVTAQAGLLKPNPPPSGVRKSSDCGTHSIEMIRWVDPGGYTFGRFAMCDATTRSIVAGSVLGTIPLGTLTW